MLNRQQQLILHLAYADGPLTSKELAQMLNVSDRTVKKDMHFVEEELAKNGARLISKQNKGYSLEITDLVAYNNMCILLVLGNTGNPLEEASAEKDTLYIARKLVASEEGVKAEDLEEEIYLSRGAARAHQIREHLKDQSVVLRAYTAAEIERNILSLFPAALMITSGSIRDGELVVEDTKSEKDIHLDLPRLTEIERALAESES